MPSDSHGANIILSHGDIDIDIFLFLILVFIKSTKLFETVWDSTDILASVIDKWC